METSTENLNRQSNEIESNILVDELGPNLDAYQLSAKLINLPPQPTNLASTRMHIRMHQLLSIRELYVPTAQIEYLATYIDQAIRHRYSLVNPSNAKTWMNIFEKHHFSNGMESPVRPITIFGESGTGKSAGVRNYLSIYGEQVHFHKSIQMMASEVPQLVWLLANVPASGRAEDLAVNLLQALDEALRSSRFAAIISSEKRNVTSMLAAWRDVTQSHFLGVLHLDDAQYLFNEELNKNHQEVEAKNRALKSHKTESALEAVRRISEEWCIPIIMTGTPDKQTNLYAESDAMVWFQGCTHMAMHQIIAGEDQFFRDTFFPILCRYQWVKKPIACTYEFASLVLMLSGGIYQIIITLWIAAHRVAFEEGRDELCSADFMRAASTYLSPLKLATEALRLDAPQKLSRFEDLLDHGHQTWKALDFISNCSVTG